MTIQSRPLPMVLRNGKRKTNHVDDVNPNNTTTENPKPTKKQRPFSNLSPTSRKVKKQQLAVVVDAAFKRLLAIRAANGGMQRHSDIQTVLDEFKLKDLGHVVERHHLEYRMMLHQN